MLAIWPRNEAEVSDETKEWWTFFSGAQDCNAISVYLGMGVECKKGRRGAVTGGWRTVFGMWRTAGGGRPRALGGSSDRRKHQRGRPCEVATTRAAPIRRTETATEGETDATDRLEGGREPPGGLTGPPGLTSGRKDHRKTSKERRGRTLAWGKEDRDSGQRPDPAAN
ncbi:hypothetical protein Trydic_g22543 [Trypoxylus dichotomus]